MNATARIAAAVAGGYLLGRTKKLKLAITVGSMLAGQRISTNPRDLLRQGVELIESNPELAKLSEQVRTQLLQALRTAAVSTASDGMNQLSDAIHARSERLSLPKGQEDEEPEDLPEEEEETEEGTDDLEAEEGEPEEQEEEEEEPAAEAEEEPEPRRRPTRRTSRGPATKSAAKKAPAKKAPAKKAPAKKTAKAPAKRSTAKKQTSKKSSTSRSARTRKG